MTRFNSHTLFGWGHGLVLVVALSISVGLCHSAFACRYSVREVGFVNLDESPYKLLIYSGDATEESVARLKRAAYAAFTDTDVEILDALSPSDKGVDYVSRFEISTFPAAVLVAPEGQALPVVFSESQLADENALLAALRPLVSSPLKDQLREQVVEPFCTVLLIHGDDAKLDVTTKDRALKAIQELTDSMDQLEKATKVPPQFVELTADQRETESALLWSLGLSAADLTQPRVAVLFGRARRMGSVLRGDRVTQESLVEIMKLIGASCECGLDRKWMQGPMLLLEWDTDDQARLAKHLGFDPESPLVKTEISQIIAQGMAQGVTASTQSVMGIFEPATETAAASAGFGDALVVENVPLGESEALVVEDIPVEGGDYSETVAVSLGQNGVEVIDVTDDTPISHIWPFRKRPPVGNNTPVSAANKTDVSVTYGEWLKIFVALFFLLNILGATYLYRKRTRQ